MSADFFDLGCSKD